MRVRRGRRGESEVHTIWFFHARYKQSGAVRGSPIFWLCPHPERCARKVHATQEMASADMTAVARMMQSMGMGSISSMMGLDGRGGMGFIQPASAHDTPSELVSLILRPHGGGMPMGMAGDFLGKIGMGALSYCDADQWDALSGYGALSDYVAKGREREVVTALAARPVAIRDAA